MRGCVGLQTSRIGWVGIQSHVRRSKPAAAFLDLLKEWERGSFLVMMQISAGCKNLSLRGSVHSANRHQADAPNE